MITKIKKKAYHNYTYNKKLLFLDKNHKTSKYKDYSVINGVMQEVIIY